MKEKFGLNNNIIELKNGRKLCGGFWEYGAQTSGFGDLLCHPDVIVIHDPKHGFNDVSMAADTIKRIVFVLSYGHSLIDFWQGKGLGPGTEYFMPLWTEEEATIGARVWNLGLHEGGEGPTFSKQFRLFGGCI